MKNYKESRIFSLNGFNNFLSWIIHNLVYVVKIWRLIWGSKVTLLNRIVVFDLHNFVSKSFSTAIYYLMTWL